MASIYKVKKTGGFRAQIRLAGFKPEGKCFTKKVDANIWASQREVEIRQGRHTIEEKERQNTAAEMVDRYIKTVLPVKTAKVRSREMQKKQLLWWKQEIGKYTLDNLTPALLTGIRDKMAKDKKPGTVNRYFAALSHVFTVAYKEWQIIRENPLKRISMMREPRLRLRYLTDEERIDLLTKAKKIDEHLYLFILMALFTGARKNEILTLKWQDINFQKNRALLHETKNDQRRSIFFYGKAADELKTWHFRKRKNFRHVFAGRVDEPVNIYPAWYRLMKQMHLVDFHIHDLRHCFATELARKGKSLQEIAELLGHSDLRNVQRYAHLVDSHASQVVKDMNESLITEGGQAPLDNSPPSTR